ncbi:MAG: Na+/H+ antiporter NhaA [Acidimicrobiales bacterium]|nr:Na+/H+ antiporter NhaA [Acidimicrobiales bacterium]
MSPSTDRPTWLRSDRFLARSIARPVTRFLHVEASGGILLAVAAVVALVWANSPWGESYRELWTTELGIDLGGHLVSQDLRHWINDGLMTLFFFVIGLEIKQELVNGQLTTLRDAAVPAAGALGGMVVPALIYVAWNLGGEGAEGWGIPMATDVAFALGVLALLGSRVPAELKVLLLGLAIVDDVGAIVVIAAFYSEGLAAGWAAAAVGGLVLVVLLRRARVRYLPVYTVLGSAIWLATFESGVHATIAGVALGLLAPARPFLPQVDADQIAGELSTDEDVTAAEVRDISFRLRESVPTTERLQDLLHPWTSYLIVPLFALANAGVELSADGLGDAATSPVTLGVAFGLVVGKLVGVAGAILLATRLGIGRLPDPVTPRHVVGMAGVAGIGFTVSIFIAGLAFDDPALTDEATIGILGASLLAAGLGCAILRKRSGATADSGAQRPGTPG